ncbi:hypothetical protein Droror1_Dr00013063 [Drosera rotundifolia]
MRNLFCSEYRIHRRFDLKGSRCGQTTEKPEGEIDETTTLKDLDLNFKFRLQTSWYQELIKIHGDQVAWSMVEVVALSTLPSKRRRNSLKNSSQEIWKVIEENKDLDHPAHKVMVATVCCEEIAHERFSSFTVNKRVEPAFQAILGHLRSGTIDKFKEAFDKALNGNKIFLLLLTATLSLSSAYWMKDALQAKWDTSKVRENLLCDIEAHIASVRETKLYSDRQLCCILFHFASFGFHF